MAAETDVMEKVVALTKRRGFVFPTAEIYGGMSGCYDYGPVGAELRRLIRDDWWRTMVTAREDVVGLESSILMPARVWEVSGHVAGFHDPLVDCKKCKGRFRADTLADARCPERPSKRPGECGGELTEPRQFNMMFKTVAGPVQEEGATVYLRPETAQGIFVNFKNVLESTRVRVPFGIAQIGKAFRNEIVVRQFVFRLRELEQMECEFFCVPGTEDAWFEHWKAYRLRWWTELGVRPSRLRLRPHDKEELAHYARGCVDVEYRFPFGWKEVEGIASRTDFDLKAHQAGSGKGLAYLDETTKQWVVPFVVEPSAGVDRCFLTVLVDAYEEETKANGETASCSTSTPSSRRPRSACTRSSRRTGCRSGRDRGHSKRQASRRLAPSSPPPDRRCHGIRAQLSWLGTAGCGSTASTGTGTTRSGRGSHERTCRYVTDPAPPTCRCARRRTPPCARSEPVGWPEALRLAPRPEIRAPVGTPVEARHFGMVPPGESTGCGLDHGDRRSCTTSNGLRRGRDHISHMRCCRILPVSDPTPG